MRKLCCFYLFFSLGIFAVAQTTSDYIQEKTIRLSSTGSVLVIPDEASFQIRLGCIDRDISISKTCLTEKSNQLIKDLVAAGIAKKDIQTTSIEMRKNYQWKNGERVFEGYSSSVVNFVKIRELDKLDEIYTELLGNEDLEINGLNYSHSMRESFQNQAYLQALDKANVLADKLISKVGATKKEILQISNVQFREDPQPRNYGQMNIVQEDMRSNESSPVEISAGMIKIQATLFVEYRFK
jgi:uncharacterized protein YggE